MTPYAANAPAPPPGHSRTPQVYFKEQFNDDKWESRWVASTFPDKSASDMGA